MTIQITKIKSNGDHTTSTQEVAKGVSPLDALDWDDARDFLEGYVEVIGLRTDGFRHKTWMMVDEDGLPKALAPNHTASVIAGRRIVGNAIWIEVI